MQSISGDKAEKSEGKADKVDDVTVTALTPMDKLSMLRLQSFQVTSGMFYFEPFYGLYDAMMTLCLLGILSFLWSQAYYCFGPAVTLSWVTGAILWVAFIFTLMASGKIMLKIGWSAMLDVRIGMMFGFFSFFISIMIAFMIPSSILDVNVPEGLHLLQANFDKIAGLLTSPGDSLVTNAGVDSDNKGIGDVLKKIVKRGEEKAAVAAASMAAAASGSGGGGNGISLEGNGSASSTTTTSNTSLNMCILIAMVGLASAYIAASAPMPALQFGKTVHLQLQKGSGASILRRCALYLDLLLPWICAFMWIIPLSYDRWFSDHMSLGEWRKARLIAALCCALLHMLLLQCHLQNFLELAVKKDALSILTHKIVDAHALRNCFSTRIQYLIVVASQHLVTALTIIMGVLLILHKGGAEGETGLCAWMRSTVRLLPWDQAREQGLATLYNQTAGGIDSNTAAETGTSSGGGAWRRGGGGGGSALSRLFSRLGGQTVMPSEAYLDVIGFLVWWACVVWAISHTAGYLYCRVYTIERDLALAEKKTGTTTGSAAAAVAASKKKEASSSSMSSASQRRKAKGSKQR